MNGARYARIAIMIVLALSAVGMLVFTVQSVGHVPWWFLMAMALTVVNGAVVTYAMYLQSVHGPGPAAERLNLVSRYLTWAMLLAGAAILARRG